MNPRTEKVRVTNRGADDIMLKDELDILATIPTERERAREEQAWRACN